MLGPGYDLHGELRSISQSRTVIGCYGSHGSITQFVGFLSTLGFGVVRTMLDAYNSYYMLSFLANSGVSLSGWVVVKSVLIIECGFGEDKCLKMADLRN